MGYLGSLVKKKSMFELLVKILVVVILLDIEVSLYRVLIDFVIFRFNFNFSDVRLDLNLNQDYFDILIIFLIKLFGIGYRKG